MDCTTGSTVDVSSHHTKALRCSIPVCALEGRVGSSATSFLRNPRGRWAEVEYYSGGVMSAVFGC